MESDNKSTSQISHKNPEAISFFDKDSGFVFVFKKTEKLASAVYMITGLFADNEPMKWTLRKKASDLLSFILHFKDLPESGMSDFVYSIKTKVLELVSLLEISQRGGLISDMNFSILKQEFINLVDVLSSIQNSPKPSTHETFSKTFFDVQSGDSALKDRFFPQQAGRQTTQASATQMSYSSIKDMTASNPRSEFKRSNRQNIILALLKKKKEVTIKDIAQVIKDCSEKTIQRELISFMEAGVLKRTGERRWSKYSLA